MVLAYIETHGVSVNHLAGAVLVFHIFAMAVWNITYNFLKSLQARLPDIYNYELIETENITHDYEITPKKLTITIENQTMVYNGMPFQGFTATNVGVADNDTLEEILERKG